MPIIKKTGNNVTKTFTDSENTTPNIHGIISGETVLDKITLDDTTGSNDVIIKNNNGIVAIDDKDIVDVSSTQTLTNKTLTTPTIDDQTNMQHTHEDASSGGILPITEFSSDSTGSITMTSNVEITEIDLGTVTAGDIIHVEYMFRDIEKSTGGMIYTSLLKKSGTATIKFGQNLTEVGQSMYAIAIAELSITSAITMRITGSGTLVIKLTGDSQDGDALCEDGEGQLYARFIKKN